MAWFRKLAAAAVLVVTAIATPSAALLVQPVYMDMRYTGAQSSAGLTVINDRNRPMTVEVTLNRIELPDEGAPVFTPIEPNDFLIFPAVATIPANGTQVFRVRWIGEPKAEGELYAFTTSELPVEVETDATAALQLLYAIQTIVGIAPAGAQPDLSAESVVRGENADGVKGVRILFANTGNAHGQVTGGGISVSSGSWSHRFSAEEVSGAVGLGLVRANGKRWMFLPLPSVPETGDLTVTADIPRITRG